MNRQVWAIAGLAACLAGGVPFGPGLNAATGPEQKAARTRSESDPPLPTFRIPYDVWTAALTQQQWSVEGVSDDGTTRLRWNGKSEWDQTAVTEGHYLLVTDNAEPRGKALLIAARIEEVRDDRFAVVRLSPAAARQLVKGEIIVPLRPPGSATQALRAAPDVAVTEFVGILQRLSPSERRAAILRGRLSEIVRALHTYHEIQGNFPPAVVYGPDGKPWHSWRILIAPLLGSAGMELYNDYEFGEPWDGPTNRNLLDRIPETFRGPGNDDAETPFVVVTGKQTAFPSGGVQWSGDTQNLGAFLSPPSGTRNLEEFTDGTSNVLFIGVVETKDAVPWLKPDDLTLADGLPALGDQGAFATFQSDGEDYGLFGMVDGRVVGIPTSLPKADLHDLLTINDGNVTAMPTVKVPSARVKWIEIGFRRGPGGVKAQLREGNPFTK